jgi:hypothetical protein
MGAGAPAGGRGCCGACGLYADVGIRQSIFCPATRRTIAQEQTDDVRRDGGQKMPWTKPVHRRRLWGLNTLRRCRQHGERSRFGADDQRRMQITRARDGHSRPDHESRAVHGRCDRRRRTRRPRLDPSGCGEGTATFPAGDHHEVSGVRNPARDAGERRSMMFIFP